MAFTFGFYNSKNHDRRYNALQMGKIFDGLILDGVFATIGNAMVVRVAEGLQNSVIVGSGKAWFNHTWNENDSDMILTGEQGELILDRIDAVVLDINGNKAYRENSIKFVKGTPSSQPQKPTLIKSADHNQYPLAYITRPANSEAITAEQIENAVGTSACPFVTGILETIDIDLLLQQWGAQWNAYYNKYTSEMDATKEKWDSSWSEWFTDYTTASEGEYTQWLTEQQTIFMNWFNGLQDILDEDTAANLAQMVLDLKKRTESLEEFVEVVRSEYAMYYSIQDNRDRVILDSNGDPIIGRALFVMK